MSNKSIILRLEDKFNEFSKDKSDPLKFGSYIEDSVNALEAVDHNIILAARNFSNRLEDYTFFPEEPLEIIIADIQTWITSIKKDMN